MRKLFFLGSKISILSLTLFFVLKTSIALSAGLPVNLDNCDYDTVIIGYGHEFEIQGDKYSVEIESGGSGYVVNGIVNDPLYTQITYAKNSAKSKKYTSQALQELHLAEGMLPCLQVWTKSYVQLHLILNTSIFSHF